MSNSMKAQKFKFAVSCIEQLILQRVHVNQTFAQTLARLGSELSFLPHL